MVVGGMTAVGKIKKKAKEKKEKGGRGKKRKSQIIFWGEGEMFDMHTIYTPSCIPFCTKYEILYFFFIKSL